MFEHFHLRQQLDTIEDHHNKHTIEDQGCSWTTPLENCVAHVNFREPQKDEAKKVKERKL